MDGPEREVLRGARGDGGFSVNMADIRSGAAFVLCVVGSISVQLTEVIVMKFETVGRKSKSTAGFPLQNLNIVGDKMMEM